MKRFLAASSLGEVEENLDGGFSGVLFGAEFCPWRLPGLRETEKAKALCAERGLAFVAVTPVAVESQLERVCRWLAVAAGDGSEWVANDFGVLRWAFGNKVGGQATAGRMLSRQQRDARLAAMADEADPTTAERLKGSLWDDPVTVSTLMEMGVTRFALDAVAFGIGAPTLPPGASLVVHGPFAVVTWSPWCHFRRSERGPCGRDCLLATPLRLENDEEATPLWTRGNALFARLDEEEAERLAGDAGAKRYVHSPAITC